MAIDDATGPFPAAQDLLVLIREQFPTGGIPAFCEAKGLDRFKVQKAIKGEILRIDVDFAFAVDRATDGRVKAERWCLDDEARDEFRRRRAEETKRANAAE
jgi:hypothetical protein